MKVIKKIEYTTTATTKSGKSFYVKGDVLLTSRPYMLEKEGLPVYRVELSDNLKIEINGKWYDGTLWFSGKDNKWAIKIHNCVLMPNAKFVDILIDNMDEMRKAQKQLNQDDLLVKEQKERAILKQIGDDFVSGKLESDLFE